MLNFSIQIIVASFLGICFLVLAKRYQKSKILYFCVGFFICLGVRILYLILYGFVTDFKVDNQFDFHRNLSILLSVIVSYLFFITTKYKLKRNQEKSLEIFKIGEE